MLNEFKKFILRGNVLDLAIGVVIGTAFGKVVSSLVADVLMPPIGLLLGKVDFSNLYVSLSGETYATLAEAKKAGAPTLNYGLFINSIFDFVLIAAAIFAVVKLVNRLQDAAIAAPPAASPTTRECPECLSLVPLKARKCSHCTSALASY